MDMALLNVFWGEVIGTFLLILLGVGVNANVLLNRSKGNESGWIVISCGWGFAVGISVYVVGWASGGHLNPAITLALTAIGKSHPSLLSGYLLGQFIGALLGAFVAWLVYYPHWAATPDGELKLKCFATKPAIRRPFFNFLTEFFATLVLTLGVLGILNGHNNLSNTFGPYVIGILILVIGLCLGGPTGFAINPVRDICPRIIHALVPMRGKGSSDWSYAWVPILGPILGGLAGAYLYQYLIEPLQQLSQFHL
jgi:glycerol uptake facilitator protein